LKENSSGAYLSNQYYLFYISERQNTVIVERPNGRHGKHRASREADHGAHWGRDAVELDPNRIDGVVIAGRRVE